MAVVGRKGDRNTKHFRKINTNNFSLTKASGIKQGKYKPKNFMTYDEFLTRMCRISDDRYTRLRNI